MRNRQRKTLSLEVSASQRDVLDRAVASLPKTLPDEPAAAGTTSTDGLPGLFYHPNIACRVMALALSAATDAVNGNADQAARKLDRAIQVFTLVDDDAAGRGHLEALRGQLAEDVVGALQRTHEAVVPYLWERMAQEATPRAVEQKAMPRLVQDGEDMPVERRSGRATRRERPHRERAPSEERKAGELRDDGGTGAGVPDDTDAQEAAEAEGALDAVPAYEGETAPEAGGELGPTEAEAAAAAAAALAAIEAPYEDLDAERTIRRFDPDRDLDPEDGRRRRRRSRGPEGLERAKADPKGESEPEGEPEPARGPEPAQEAEPAQGREPAKGAEPAVATGTPAAGREREHPAPARDDEAIGVSQAGPAGELADIGLALLRDLLRKARESRIDGRIVLEMTVSAAGAGAGSRRRRRRRGHRPDPGRG